MPTTSIEATEESWGTVIDFSPDASLEDVSTEVDGAEGAEDDEGCQIPDEDDHIEAWYA